MKKRRGPAETDSDVAAVIRLLMTQGDPSAGVFTLSAALGAVLMMQGVEEGPVFEEVLNVVRVTARRYAGLVRQIQKGEDPSE